MEVRFEIPGKPSTDHRARSFRKPGGDIGHRKSKAFASWKRRARTCASIARPKRWPMDARYAVEVIGYVPEERIDADNLRGALDALEGVLWRNDRQVRPVVYHYAKDADHPRVVVHVVAYDPRTTIAEIEVCLVSRESAGAR